jgi:hypothetical protein
VCPLHDCVFPRGSPEIELARMLLDSAHICVVCYVGPVKIRYPNFIGILNILVRTN